MTTRSASVCGAVLALLLVLGAPLTAHADTISLGSLSFDQYIEPIPGDDTSIGLNAINIFDFTGIWALSSLNPLTAVSLENASLLLTPADGSAPVNMALGTILPGPFVDGLGMPPVLLHTSAFTSMVFTATLSTLSVSMADGSTFLASSPDLLFTLARSDGGPLAPNPIAGPFDTSVEFLIDGTLTPASVPEPSTLLLLASGFGLVVRSQVRRRARA